MQFCETFVDKVRHTKFLAEACLTSFRLLVTMVSWFNGRVFHLRIDSLWHPWPFLFRHGCESNSSRRRASRLVPVRVYRRLSQRPPRCHSICLVAIKSQTIPLCDLLLDELRNNAFLVTRSPVYFPIICSITRIPRRHE
jgi:hypothetical protein